MDLNRWYWYRAPGRLDTLARLRSLEAVIRRDGGGVSVDEITLGAGCRLWRPEPGDLAGWPVGEVRDAA